MRNGTPGRVALGVLAAFWFSGFSLQPSAFSADWPCWRGPDGSGIAAPCEKPIVDDLEQMRRVWQSEERDIPGNCWHGKRHGGYDSPIVADGKVVISYQEGPGDCMPKHWKEVREKAGKEIPDSEMVVCDYVVLCVDAANGKTLWKTKLDAGPNMVERRKRPGMHHSPCYWNGKIYAQSTLGRVYGLDAKDGKVVWKADSDKTEYQLKVTEAYRKAGIMHPYRGVEPEPVKGLLPHSFQHPVTVADGVVVAASAPRFDAETGEKLGDGFGDGHCAPLRWAMDKKEYIIKGPTCYEPRTGKVLWQIKGLHVGMTPTLGEGYVVYGLGKQGMACYAITPEGFEKKWSNERSPSIPVGVIHDGWYYGIFNAREARPESEHLVAFELATGKSVGPISMVGVWQTLCTSLVGTDGRAFGMAGAGYSGMFMFRMDPEKFELVGLRKPTNKTGITPLPDGADKREKLDYLLTSTPAIVDGRIYWRGQDSLFCYDLKKQ